MVSDFLFRQVHYRDIGIFLRDGEIRSKNHPKPQSCHQTSYANIVAMRNTSVFSLPGGGVVNDYVPFYFSPITAFCFTIHRGNVDVVDPSGRPIGKSTYEDRAFLVFPINAIVSSGLQCCFSDVALNSQAPIPTVTDVMSLLPTHVDWALFDEAPKSAAIPEIGYGGVCTWFHNRPAPQNHQLRLTKRMAEFLIRDSVPIGLAVCVVVENDKVAKEVNAMISASGYQIPVLVKPGCFCR